jgi:hypothetical protein
VYSSNHGECGFQLTPASHSASCAISQIFGAPDTSSTGTERAHTTTPHTDGKREQTRTGWKLDVRHLLSHDRLLRLVVGPHLVPCVRQIQLPRQLESQPPLRNVSMLRGQQSRRGHTRSAYHYHRSQSRSVGNGHIQHTHPERPASWRLAENPRRACAALITARRQTLLLAAPPLPLTQAAAAAPTALAPPARPSIRRRRRVHPQHLSGAARLEGPPSPGVRGGRHVWCRCRGPIELVAQPAPAPAPLVGLPAAVAVAAVAKSVRRAVGIIHHHRSTAASLPRAHRTAK